MVFGWGKKKEEKKHESVETAKTINLNDIPKTVDDLVKLREKQLISEVSIMLKKTNPQIKELSKITKQLEKDDLKVDDIDKHLRIVVVRGKKQVIAVMKKEISELPKISTYDDVVKAMDDLNQMLKKIGNVLGRHTRIIHIFAKKHADKLKQILEDINNNHDEIENLIKNHQTTKEYANSIIANYQKLLEFKESISKNKKKTQELDEQSDSLQSEINSVSNSIDEIKSSKEYQEYLKLRDRLSNLKNEKSKIKNDINVQFTKVSRPLNRYEYIAALDKDHKTLLHKLSTEPFEVINKPNKDSIIIILENIRKEITLGSISVKDVEKTMTALTETVESLDTFISKISQYNKTTDDLTRQREDIKPKKLAKLEDSLEQLHVKQTDLKTKLSHVAEEINTAKDSIPKLSQQIEKDLQKFSSTKYTIVNQD